MIKKFFSHEEGQGLVEYALILVLVAIVVIAVLLVLGPEISNVYCRVANALQPGSCGALSIVSGPILVPQPGGKYDLSVVVSVAEQTTVTFSGGGKSTSTTCAADTNCPISLLKVSAPPGTYTIEGGGAQISGSY